MGVLYIYIINLIGEKYGKVVNGTFYIHFDQLHNIYKDFDVGTSHFNFSSAPKVFNFLFSNITTANSIELYDDEMSISVDRVDIEKYNEREDRTNK